MPMHHPRAHPRSHCVVSALVAGTAFLLLSGCEPPRPPEPEAAEVPVRTEIVERSDFRPSIRLLGRVEPAARFTVSPEAAGTLRYPDRFSGGLRTGERVEAGELLFTVVHPKRRLALEEARLQAELTSSELERTRLGVEGGFLPEGDLDRAEIEARLARQRLADAEEDMERLEARAERAGVLRVDRTLPPGSRVTASNVVAEIAGDGGLRVEAWAAAGDVERLADALGTGDDVPARLLAPGDRRLVGRGRLEELAREVGDGGVARAVIAVREDLGMPQVGDGVEAELLLPVRSGVISVPERALVEHGSVATVYVLEPLAEGYRARSRQVIPGTRHDGRVEILDGLSSGETVAVAGVELLADGLPAVDADADADADESDDE